jgi:hypothetical protein
MGTYQSVRVRSHASPDVDLTVHVAGPVPPVGSEVSVAGETDGFIILEGGEAP